MADAELRFKAVLDDDASRGIDKLADKTQDAGTKAAKANSTIGSSATHKEVLENPETISGEDVLSGFELKVREIF